MKLFGRPLPQPRRFLRRHRRALAALCAGLAAWACLAALSPPAPAHRTVLVAAREIAGGERLVAADVATVELPTAAIPDKILTSADQAIGRIASAGVARGQVLTQLSVVSGTGQAASGSVIMTITLADTAVLSLVRAGDRVDLIALSGQTGRAGVVAASVRVVALPSSGSSGPLGLAGGGGSWILVEVPVDAMTQLIEAMSVAKLTLALH